MLFFTARFFLGFLDHLITFSYSHCVTNKKRERTAPPTVRSFSITQCCKTGPMQGHALINGCLLHKQSLYIVMIRKNSLLCKLFRIKTSSKFIFDTFMNRFRPELETCPICNSKGNCHVHDYYDRTITDFRNQRKHTESLCVMRVMCESCGHTHAILPDIIIPYSSYGIIFVLSVLGDYFSGIFTVEELCEKYDISQKQFYKWRKLWSTHKKIWLGILNDSETNSSLFHDSIFQQTDYSCFSMEFIRKFSYSFLQSHKNPIPPGCKNAHYCQQVFSPDIFVPATT